MMIARSTIVISLLLLWSPASAETIDQLKSIIASNICPRDLKTYNDLSYHPACDSFKDGSRAVLQCQDKINAENAAIEKYNMFVINCRSSRDSLDGSQRLGRAQPPAAATSQPCADAANSCEKNCFHIFGPDGEQKPGAVQACDASCGNQLNQCMFEGKELPNASVAVDSGDATLHRGTVASQSPTSEQVTKPPAQTPAEPPPVARAEPPTPQQAPTDQSQQQPAGLMTDDGRHIIQCLRGIGGNPNHLVCLTVEPSRQSADNTTVNGMQAGVTGNQTIFGNLTRPYGDALRPYP